MSLIDQIADEIKLAQKAGDVPRLETLRFLTAQVKNREIEKRGSGSTEPLTAEEIEQVIGREVKKRREAIALYESGNRADLAAKEAAELAILEAYLPKQLSRDEVGVIIDRVIASGVPREFAPIMKAAMAELKGRADGKMVGEMIRAKIA